MKICVGSVGKRCIFLKLVDEIIIEKSIVITCFSFICLLSYLIWKFLKQIYLCQILSHFVKSSPVSINFAMKSSKPNYFCNFCQKHAFFLNICVKGTQFLVYIRSPNWGYNSFIQNTRWWPVKIKIKEHPAPQHCFLSFESIFDPC